MLKVIRKGYFFLFFCIFIAGFILLEIRYLNRPYYWDEAWSYASAIKAMFESGPSLLPGAIHEYLYRGHPTFFYFLTTIWMNVFGTSLVAVHSLFLIISVSLIFSIYFIGNSLFNKTTGMLAATMLMATPMFIVQASFLLPEVLIALLTLFTLWAYLKKKLIVEIVFGSILVLTKETGLLVVFVILLFELVSAVKEFRNSKNWPSSIKPILLHAVPLVVALSFYITQKLKMGWFFYPEHLGMMNFGLGKFLYKLVMISRQVFQLQGRIILLLSMSAGLFYLFKKQKLSAQEKKFIAIAIVFILVYLLFAAFNFFTNRYLLSVFPVYFLLTSLIITRVFDKRKYIPFLITGLFVGISLSAALKDKGHGDDNLGFKNIIKVHQEAVKYCEEATWYQKDIQTHSLMIYNLTEPFMGYITKGEGFKQVSSFNDIEQADVVIISSIESPAELQNKLRSGMGFSLVKRFEQKNAWCEIYIKE